MPEPIKKLFIDFDGVIHAYESAWTRPSEIKDGPVIDSETGQSSVQWLTRVLQSGHFEVHIFSRRATDPSQGGIVAMQNWLLEHGLSPRYLKRLKFETGKPDWHLIIDDRAIGFDGDFPMAHELKSFRPWNKRRDD